MVSKYKSILLVEDDKEDQLFLMDVMETIDPAIGWVMADNGDHAFELLRNLEPQKPDLIFLDLSMPKMNGVEFIRQLKQVEGYGKIPIVVLSHMANLADACYELGVSLYVKKPTRARVFRGLILDLLTRDVEKECEDLRALYSEGF